MRSAVRPGLARLLLPFGALALIGAVIAAGVAPRPPSPTAISEASLEPSGALEASPDDALAASIATPLPPAPSTPALASSPAAVQDIGPFAELALTDADPTPLPPPTEPFELNLYSAGDFVPQYTFEWCVGASIQMALNIGHQPDDRSRALQQRLWEQARDLSNSPFGGANPVGWTAALNVVSAGSYVLVSQPNIDTALGIAAAAIRRTSRPVGLVMWAGRHAWVMSGFTSLGDPASAPNFQVTGVRVLDPLYPYGSDSWGPSPQPNALLDVATLGTQFVARLHGRSNLGVAPGYLLVLPIAA